MLAAEDEYVEAAVLGAVTAGAQDRPAVELSGAGWVNTPGLSLERLRGKIVLLYFFEET